jgi:hypothetical protein
MNMGIVDTRMIMQLVAGDSGLAPIRPGLQL